MSVVIIPSGDRRPILHEGSGESDRPPRTRGRRAVAEGSSYTRNDRHLPSVGPTVPSILRQAKTSGDGTTDCGWGAPIHSSLYRAQTQRATKLQRQPQPRQQCASCVGLRVGSARNAVAAVARETCTTTTTVTEGVLPLPARSQWGFGKDAGARCRDRAWLPRATAPWKENHCASGP